MMIHLRCKRRVWALAIALWPLAAAAQSRVPRWAVYEVNLTASGSSSNWYTDRDAAVTATLRGPDGSIRNVTGFWDGANSFKLRLTLTKEGIWSYATASSNAGLNGKAGKLICIPPLTGKRGFVRIDARQPNSFVRDDGGRYFMWGQTYYDVVISAMANDHWKEGVDRSFAYGMNKVRLHVYAQTYYKPEVEFNGYPDVQPYLGTATSPDRDRLNIPYWRKLDDMVRYMDSKGIVADLILTNPYWNNRMFGTAEQNDRFVRYVLARYAAYSNVIWCVANEWSASKMYAGSYPQTRADFDRMGEIAGKEDPWRAEGELLRPLSIHNTSSSIGFEFFESKWPTYVANQYHNSRYVLTRNGDEWGNSGITFNARLARERARAMPLANDKYGYIGQTHPPLAAGATMTREMLRGAIWGIAVAGGYGSSGDIRLHPNGKGNPEITGDWLDAPDEYDDLKRLVEFFTTKDIEYWRMTGRNDLMAAGSRTYALAEPGRQYVIYAAAGGKFSVNLAAGTYSARRYDPRDGTVTDLGTVAGPGVTSASVPVNHDYTVYLVRIR